MTAVSSGYATVTAWADGMSDTCTVIVRAKDEVYLDLSSSVEELFVGGKVTLDATVGPAFAANASVEWTSTNESAAMVDDDGNVTAISEGATVIIAEARGAYDVCVVVVADEEQEVIAEQAMESETIDNDKAPQPEAVEETVTQNGEATNGAADKAGGAEEGNSGKPGELPMWAGALIGFFGAGILGGGALLIMRKR